MVSIASHTACPAVTVSDEEINRIAKDLVKKYSGCENQIMELIFTIPIQLPESISDNLNLFHLRTAILGEATHISLEKSNQRLEMLDATFETLLGSVFKGTTFEEFFMGFENILTNIPI